MSVSNNTPTILSYTFHYPSIALSKFTTLKTVSYHCTPGLPKMAWPQTQTNLMPSCLGHVIPSLSVISHVDVTGTLVPMSDKVKLLGVIIDRHMTLDKHVNEICRSSYFHTRALRHVRNAISDDTAKTVAQALVSSRSTTRTQFYMTLPSTTSLNCSEHRTFLHES